MKRRRTAVLAWAAAAVVAAAASISAAAFGPILAYGAEPVQWIQTEQGWRCCRTDGSPIVSQTAESGGELYFLDENGLMAVNQWRQLGDGEERFWAYFGRDGAAVRERKKELDGKIYFFDPSGHMITGWVSEDGEALDDSSGEAYLDGMYYCGGPDEGWAVTGWKYLLIQRENGGMERRWFYFKPSGKKAVDTSITESDENGQYRYTFDEYGILRSSRKIGGSSSSGSEDGQWIERVPTSSQDSYANANGIKRWYYGLSSGNVVQDRMRTINGEEYLFDQVGIMRTGLIAVTPEKRFAETLICAGDDIDCDVDTLESYLDEYDLMYFDEASGARKEGKVSITSYGETHTFMFADNGKAVHGDYKGYLYRAGVLQKAEDDRYEIVRVDDHEYLVNGSGRIQGAGRYKDGDVVWVVAREDGEYVITRELQ